LWPIFHIWPMSTNFQAWRMVAADESFLSGPRLHCWMLNMFTDFCMLHYCFCCLIFMAQQSLPPPFLSSPKNQFWIFYMSSVDKLYLLIWFL
jgi:hypothetical protein